MRTHRRHDDHVPETRWGVIYAAQVQRGRPAGVTAAQRHARAKRWGRAHGFEGRAGGWIYRTTLPGYGPIVQGLKVCQGWLALYERYWAEIEGVAEGQNGAAS